MKARNLLVACLVCAVFAVCVLVVRPTRDGTVSIADQEQRAAELARARPAGKPQSHAVGVETPPSDDGANGELHAAASQGNERAERSGVAHLVTGRVVIPPGTPADEHVRLFVRVFEREHEGEWAELGADGRFAIEMGPGEEGAEIGLFARYLFLTERIAVTDTAHEVVIEPELGACIEGRIRVPAGYEALFHEFEVSLSPRSPVGTHTNWRENCEPPRTESDGSFVIEGAVAGWSQHVHATSRDARDSESELFTPRPGETLHVEWDWKVGATLAGRVVDESGAPVQDAIVRCGSWRPQARTDAFGKFELRGLPPDDFQFSIGVPGFVPFSELCSAIGEAQRREGTEWVLSRGHTVHILARHPDGTPAHAPQFELGRGELSWRIGATGLAELAIERPAEGELLLTGLPEIPFEFTVRAPAQEVDALVPTCAFTGSIDPSREREVVVVLQPERRTLRGHVRFASGEPAPDASVVATALDVELAADPQSDIVAASTDRPDGEFELRLPRAGRWLVQATDETTWSPRVVVDSRTMNAPLELVLAPQGRITGRVVTPDGAPVEDAWIQGVHDTVPSQADGTFDVIATPGIVELYATRDGCAASEPVRLDVAPSADVAGVELRLRRGGTVVGRLASAAWRELDDVRITAWTLAPAGPGESRETTIADDGAFRFDALLPGMWAFEVIVQGEREQPEGVVREFRPFARVDVRDGAHHELVLGADGIRVIGRVLRGGRPVSGLALEAFAQDDGSGDGLELESDADGRFEFVAPRAGEYVVAHDREDDGGESYCTVQVPHAVRHEFVFELGTARIVGRLVADEPLALAGTPVEALRAEHGDAIRTVADAAGRFELSGLGPGTHRVVVGALEFDAHDVDPESPRVARAVAHVVLGADVESAELEVPVRRAASVYGAAWSLARRGNVRLAIVDPTSGLVLGGPRDLGASGVFRCAGVPQGRVRLEFRDADTGAALAVRELDVDASPFGPLEVQLD
ncbi:MAG: carboxypeptidase regulatory-like domain-containing protein [Planctomycetes bacterium]|nr:carboxypeptidase regulatory-like domain-containing protein [Planctomycetota bacterium]